MLPGDERNIESGMEPSVLVVRICRRVKRGGANGEGR